MSSGFGNFMKNGWHPEKEGTTFKGQVNGLLGRNKEKDRSDHVARPLSSLQNPASFAPPPKRVPGQPLPPPSRPNATSPGAPPPPYDDSNRYAQQQQQDPEEEAPPPQPYRVNTTGLSTSHLPPPPGRKDGADGRTPSPGQAAGAARPPPSLPPRLPPRTPSASSTVAAPPASSGGGYLNQNAMNRLGAAGVSVPALGIGKPAPPEPPTRSNASSPAPPSRAGAFSPPAGQMGELQNRFAKLGRSSSGQSSSPPPPPAEGTTMEQKQAALRTASNFHKDPSSVSLADARSAASTFNNFRQRHGEQVAAGVKSANNLNQKYGIADKVGNYAGQINQQQQQQQQQAGAANAGQGSSSPLPGLVNALGKKKPPPPPPPKKKPQLGGAPQPPPPGPGDDDAPPPIPLATKPTF